MNGKEILDRVRPHVVKGEQVKLADDELQALVAFACELEDKLNEEMEALSQVTAYSANDYVAK